MREIVDLHSKLSMLKNDKNIDYVAMEMTSQGLDQRRSEGVELEVGAFNNISPEHLDYHKTMDEYLEKKMILFKEVLKKGSKVVLNADIPEFEYIKGVCLEREHKILSYGYNGDIKIIEIKNSPEGQSVKLKYDSKDYVLNTPFIGDFQVMNLLGALGIVISLGVEPDINKILLALGKVKAASGRMEFAGKKKNGALIYVDYAHAPDAYEKLLKTVRNHFSYDKDIRIGILFGAGGDRDKTKRPVMGKICAELADFVFVSDDNPRTENPDEIRKEVMVGCPNAVEIPDRDKAITQAVKGLGAKDVLLLVGKGQERYQLVGKEKYYFNEFEIVERAVKEN
jgi:UDP-N-acetylmuramoyl-L-alanyl-D-glutamate--2,6-diaminopimelate ligase